MADLIDRGMTIHELEAFRESCIANLMRMSFDDITDVVKGIPTVNQWIPCSERLPEDFAWCLVCMADGFIRLGRWNAKYDDAGAWQVLMQNGDKMYRIKTVPNWMPLPEPPKEDENE